jgi:hypothetical protein|tara:strand:- start:1406 stop:2233 length:828 start_codon:yes stop_codon:yes gene_type:complete
MVKVNIRDRNFIPFEGSSCHLATNKYVEWVPDTTPVSKSCFITDLCLQDVLKATGVKRKVAWLMEPRSINPAMYHWIENNNKRFDFVLTFDDHLIDKGQNYLYYPHGRCWIHNYDNIDKKVKLCSIFASDKAFTVGHRLRHEIVDRYGVVKNIDCFGKYCNNTISNKEDGLNQYYFSITIENAILPGYWTEKLLDAFATKTIPIYYGDKKSVNKFFNPDGIIYFETIEELNAILDNLSGDLYNEKKDAVEENFNLVEQFRIPEDWIYNEYKFLFE